VEWSNKVDGCCGSHIRDERDDWLNSMHRERKRQHIFCDEKHKPRVGDFSRSQLDDNDIRCDVHTRT
jgi:hypothetical protein